MKDSYFEFKTEKESIEWINKNYKEFINKIQENSYTNGTFGGALFRYTGSMSKDYNNILKFNNGNIFDIDKVIDKYYSVTNDYIESSLNSVFAKDAKNDIKLIYEAFEINNINDNIILFHYFNINKFDNDLLKKSDFEIKYFISTTMIKNSYGINALINKNKYDSMLVIKVKKGTQCIPIGNNPNSILNEYEIILKPNSKFKIISVRKKYFNQIKYIVECELN